MKRFDCNVLLLMMLAGNAQAQFGPPTVVTDTARMETLTPVTEVAATTVSLDDARISAEVSGRLQRIADIGAVFEAGDSMAQIDSIGLELQRDELTAELEGLQARARFASEEFDRLTSLSEKNAAARNLLEQTRADRDQTRAQTRSTRARLDRVVDQIRRSRLEAPFAGVIIERYARAGESVSSGSDLLRLANRDRLELVARAPLSLMRFVQPGQILDARTTGNGMSQIFRVTVTSVVPVGDEATHLTEVRASLDAPLQMGQTARLSMPTAPSTSHLVVPRDALVLRPGQVSVFSINEDGTARQVVVTTGVAAGSLIAVEGDLAVGDEVIIRGAERLRPGQAVMRQGASRPPSALAEESDDA